MKIWITGSCGFLGSHLTQALIDEGSEVHGNDILVCGDAANARCDFDTVDCRDYNSMHRILSNFGPEILVHCAATAHEGLSSFSPSFITRNINEASVATFSAAIASGVKRIVYMSSMSRYGDGYGFGPHIDVNSGNGPVSMKLQNSGPPFRESYGPNPVDPYAVAKVAAEDTLRILAKTHDIKYSILVPHNIIGTRQRHIDPFRNVASIMINRCLQGKPPIIYGDGSQKRCFSPVSDCIPSIVKAVHGAADGEVVNIGPDNGEITIKELAEKIIRLTGFKGEPIYMPGRPNEVKDAFCSSDKARRLLDYKPRQSLDECLAEMVAAVEPKPFVYDFPIEITKGCPEVWVKRMM